MSKDVRDDVRKTILEESNKLDGNGKLTWRAMYEVLLENDFKPNMQMVNKVFGKEEYYEKGREQA